MPAPASLPRGHLRFRKAGVGHGRLGAAAANGIARAIRLAIIVDMKPLSLSKRTGAQGAD
jgi:hypothetical protein